MSEEKQHHGARSALIKDYLGSRPSIAQQVIQDKKPRSSSAGAGGGGTIKAGGGGGSAGVHGTTRTTTDRVSVNM